MEVEIRKIKSKKRIRKEIGDISSLVNSIKKYGLINPIVINSKNELLAGYRRLLAAKKLKWKTINARVVKTRDKLDKLNIEIEENVTRKDFTQTELEKGMNLKAELLKIKKMPWFIRILYQVFRGIIRFFCRLFNIEGDI